MSANLAKTLHLAGPPRLNIIGMIMGCGKIALILAGQDRPRQGLGLLPELAAHWPGLTVAFTSKAKLAARARRTLKHDLANAFGPCGLSGAIENNLGHGDLTLNRLAPGFIIDRLGEAFQVAAARTNRAGIKMGSLARWGNALAIGPFKRLVTREPLSKRVHPPLMILIIIDGRCGGQG